MKGSLLFGCCTPNWILCIAVLFLSCEKPVIDCPGACPDNLVPISEKVSAHCKGFYAFLPEGYHPDSTAIRYPALIFFHGAGETGNGSTELSRVLEHGPLKLAREGTFPSFFSVNGIEYRLLLIAPQFTKAGVFPAETDQIIEYMKDHYNLDEHRIYLTGLSIGGANCWQYAGWKEQSARKIAAMAPVAANIDEEENDLNVTTAETKNIAGANLPIWSFHNQGDPLADVNWVIRAHSKLTACSPPPRLTIFDSDIHEGWSNAYDPEYREEGKNLYDWMLEHER